MNVTTMHAVEVNPTKIILNRPWGFRIGSVIGSLIFCGFSVFLLTLIWPEISGLAGRSPLDVVGQLGEGLMIPLVGLVPIGIFLYSAGPADLILDTDRRTYRFRRGFPLLAQWREGPLDDIESVRLIPVTAQPGSILIDWRNTRVAAWSLGNGSVAGRRPFLVTTSRNQTDLQNEAQTLADRIGVSVQEGLSSWDEARMRAIPQIVVLPIAAFMIGYSFASLVVTQQLRTTPGLTSGMVTELHPRGNAFLYHYQVGGHTYQNLASVEVSTFTSVDVGSKVAVHYLLSYPHTSTVTGTRESSVAGIILLAGGLLFGLGLFAGRAPKPKRPTPALPKEEGVRKETL